MQDLYNLNKNFSNSFENLNQTGNYNPNRKDINILKENENNNHNNSLADKSSINNDSYYYNKKNKVSCFRLNKDSSSKVKRNIRKSSMHDSQISNSKESSLQHKSISSKINKNIKFNDKEKYDNYNSASKENDLNYKILLNPDNDIKSSTNNLLKINYSDHKLGFMSNINNYQINSDIINHSNYPNNSKANKIDSLSDIKSINDTNLKRNKSNLSVRPEFSNDQSSTFKNKALEKNSHLDQLYNNYTDRIANKAQNQSQSDLIYNFNSNAFYDNNLEQQCTCEVETPSSNKICSEINYDARFNELPDSQILLENSYLKFRIEELNKNQIDIMCQVKIKEQLLNDAEEAINRLKHNNNLLLKSNGTIDSMTAEINFLKLKSQSLIQANGQLKCEIEDLIKELNHHKNLNEEYVEIIRYAESKMKEYDASISLFYNKNEYKSSTYLEDRKNDLLRERENHKFSFNNNNFQESSTKQIPYQNSTEYSITALTKALEELNSKYKLLDNELINKSEEIVELKKILERTRNDQENKIVEIVNKREIEIKNTLLTEYESIKSKYIEVNNENESLLKQIKELELKNFQKSSIENDSNIKSFNENNAVKLLQEKNKLLTKNIKEKDIKIESLTNFNKQLKDQLSKISNKNSFNSLEINQKEKEVENLKKTVEQLKNELMSYQKYSENNNEYNEYDNQFIEEDLDNEGRRNRRVQIVSSLTDGPNYHMYKKSEENKEKNNSNFVHINSNSRFSNQCGNLQTTENADSKIINRSIVSEGSNNSVNNKIYYLENMLNEKESLLIKLNNDIQRITEENSENYSKLEQELIMEINKRKLAEYKLAQSDKINQDKDSRLNTIQDNVNNIMNSTKNAKSIKIDYLTPTSFSNYSWAEALSSFKKQNFSMKKIITSIKEEIKQILNILELSFIDSESINEDNNTNMEKEKNFLLPIKVGEEITDKLNCILKSISNVQFTTIN